MASFLYRSTRYGGQTPAWLAVAVLVVACGPERAAEAPYDTRTDMHELMVRVVDPAAGEIWDRAGWVSTEEGTVSLAPSTDEGWERVRNNALLVAESGNLLMLPGRKADDEAWMELSQGMLEIGHRIAELAEARDAEALFDAGGHLYNVCLACHQRYLPPDRMPTLQ